MAGEIKRRKKPREEEKKDTGIFVRLSKTVMEELEVASYTMDESKSDIVRKAIKMYISANKSRF